MRSVLKLLLFAFELSALVAGLVNAGPVAEGLRLVALIVGVVLGAAIAFVVVVWIIGVLANREPPYPI